MTKLLLVFLCLIVLLKGSPVLSQSKVLIIQDELPQMEVLSEFLTKNDKNIDVKIVDQENLPDDFSVYNSIILYIHRKLFEPTELKIIDYTKNGGRFICLHHSISSQKAKNKHYFSFMGIHLDGTDKSGDPELPGAGYAWTHPVVLTIINLNPNHYVTNYNINWNDKTIYQSSDEPGIKKEYPSISFDDSEVYVNHKFTDGREKTVLMGLKFFDKRNNQLFMQDRAGWYKKSGKGEIFYLMPGHSTAEFQHPDYAQMILNAIKFK